MDIDPIKILTLSVPQKINGVFIAGDINDGVYMRWDYTGENIVEKNYFKNGKKNGLMEKYYINGVLRQRFNFVDDKPHGPQISYFDNGQKKEEEYYEHGKKQGKQMKYNEKGVVLVKKNFVDNKTEGDQYIYSNDGKLISHTIDHRGKIKKTIYGF